MYDLTGKVAIVTGAGRRHGLGEAIARRLAGDGASVVIHDLCHTGDQTGGDVAPDHGIATMDEMEHVAAGIRADGGQAVSHAADMLVEEQVAGLIGFAVDTYGRVDILINNAGIGYLFGPIVETEQQHWDAVLGVNLRGPFLAIKHAARHMIDQGDGGRIVNIASKGAKVGRAHLAAYCSSKHGLIGLTRVAAMELAAHRITVNALCPNHVTTQLGSWQNDYMARVQNKDVATYLADMAAGIPLGRVGLVSDTADACAFLCSDQAAYITAEAMNVSGGEEYH